MVQIKGIEKAVAILKNVKPQSPFEYGKWKQTPESSIMKIALLRILSPQTKVVYLRNLEYSTDLDKLLYNLSRKEIEVILRKHKIRYAEKKVKTSKENSPGRIY